MNEVSLPIVEDFKYNLNLYRYNRLKTREVFIGELPLGGNNPIRVQSMTTCATMDTEATIAQTLRMVESGCEYVRITAPSLKEAKNLENIKKGLLAKGCHVPLVADIHFTPNAAEAAARIVEKVRINPGNYADRKNFESIEYTNESYQAELERIYKRFVPLVKICKEYGTAMRIGTNHGSLSDRILSRYGDTPLGMAESAMEFIRICEDLNYQNLVLSMKASNTQVMVQAYRLLVNMMWKEDMQYPLHLGVTEAGEAEDGRIKSAVGIASLLTDGIGDTIRVSLTEEPEFESPVGFAILNGLEQLKKLEPKENSLRRAKIIIEPERIEGQVPNPYQHIRRKAKEVLNFGENNVPRVIADFSNEALSIEKLRDVGHYYTAFLDKWNMTDQGCDFIYVGKQDIPFMLPNGLRAIHDYEAWENLNEKDHHFPLLRVDEYHSYVDKTEHRNHPMFVEINQDEVTNFDFTKVHDNIVVILNWKLSENYHWLRRLLFGLVQSRLEIPVVIRRQWDKSIFSQQANLKLQKPNAWTVEKIDQFRIQLAGELGVLFIDGLIDGLWLEDMTFPSLDSSIKVTNETIFTFLQATRLRISKTEYISCPSCGRTLFDLQKTTAMIRKRTDHLKGVKIGIMGCIVNGPGEMADADYGYVGVGPGKIALYRGQHVAQKSVKAEHAVDELINLIKEDGLWVE